MRTLFIGLTILLSILAAQADDRLPRRAWIGIAFQPVPDSIRAQFSDSGGVRVAAFPQPSPAQDAGIQAGDILLRVDGQTVMTGQQLNLRLKDYRGGQVVKADIWRNGERLTQDVTLIEAPRENPGGLDVIYESFETDGALRRMIITKPRGGEKYPTVVMFGGLGCYSLDNPPGLLNSYNEILYALTRAGFATVRIEKTGMGDSQGKPCSESDFDFEVQGLVAGLHYAATLPYVDRDNMIIFGHSMGGLTGPVAAREFPVKGLIAMATSAIGWFEYMLTNNRRQLVLEGVPYDSIEVKQVQAERAMHLHYVEKKMPDEIIKDHPEYSDYLQSPMHPTFLQDVADLNIAEQWKNVDAEVLFIYGTSDFITDDREHIYGMNVVNAYHPGHATYVEIDNLDHFFFRTPDQKSSYRNMLSGFPNKTMNRDVIPIITEWSKKLVGMDARREVER